MVKLFLAGSKAATVYALKPFESTRRFGGRKKKFLHFAFLLFP
jgi:hypothetical protein